MKRNILFYGGVAVLFACIGIYVGVQRLAPVAPQASVTANLFSQSLPDIEGKSQALAQWRGKNLIVNFWATWCTPCVEEMPELSALQKEVVGKNTQVLGIGIDSASNIAEFSSKYKISYPLYTAGLSGTELSRQFGNQVGGLPFTVLIDSGGKIKKTYLGRLNLEQLRKDLASL
jgi:thiol-disulfide isomerase/thioredoxin